jgi:hypothetical protein
VHAYTSFLYNGSTYLAIAYPGASSTIVQGVNNSGEAVGFYTLAGVTSGFIYDAGTYTSFMYRGADSTDLFGVSNSGEIVGDYTCASGTCPLSDPAFYAVPNGQGGYSVTTVNAPTPEPAGVLLLGGGLLAILASARSRTSKIFSNHN